MCYKENTGIGKKLALFLILTILSACKGNYHEELTAFVKIDENDFHNNQFDKLSDIVDSVHLIPLETNTFCILNNLKKIVIKNNLIYILDTRRESITIFDMQGKYQIKVEAIGKGPGEYLEIYDFCLLDDNIIILDRTNKIIFYDNYGSYISEQRLPFFCDAFITMGDSLFVFNGSSFDDRIIIWNHFSQQKTGSFLKYDKKYYSSRIIKPLIKYNENVYFAQKYRSFLFKVNQHDIEPARYVDLGKYNFKGDFVKTTFMGVPIFVNPLNTGLASDYIETDNFFSFRIVCEELSENWYLVLYSKTTGKKVLLNNDYTLDDVSYNITIPPTFHEPFQNAIVSPIYPMYLMKNIDKLKTTHYDIIDTDKFKQFQRKLDNVDYSDNPIIAIYYIKDF